MNSRTQNWGDEAKRLCFTSPADTAGLEPATSHYADIVVNAAGALPFKSYASFDSFPDYRSANQAEGGQTPSADAESAVSGSHKPRPSRERIVRRSCLHTGGTPDRYRRSCRSGSRVTSCQFPGKMDTFSYLSSPCCYTVYMT